LPLRDKEDRRARDFPPAAEDRKIPVLPIPSVRSENIKPQNIIGRKGKELGGEREEKGEGKRMPQGKRPQDSVTGLENFLYTQDPHQKITQVRLERSSGE